MEPVNVAIIYYSSTGNVHALARAAVEGAQKAGAQVRLRRIAETAPTEAVNSRPEWAAHLKDTADVVEVSHDDLEWADAMLFGTPARFGSPASQLRAFIDTTGPLGMTGKLTDKVYSAFTSANSAHGGLESTILALSNTFYHWGGIIVPPGYNDPVQLQAGNPYGASHVNDGGVPGEVSLAAAGFQARRVADIATVLKAGRQRLAMPERRQADEAKIRGHVDKIVEGLRAKDLAGLERHYAPGVVSFDYQPPLRHTGIAAKLNNWTDAFALFRDLDYEVRDLAITVDETVAFAHGFARLGGTLNDGTATSGVWVRVTFCFGKIDGEWLIAHDQVSVPLDVASGKGLTDLQP